VREEINPPSAAELWVLLETIVPRYRLHVRLLDATGLRVEELTLLRWGDLDLPGLRLRVAWGRTKGRTAGRR
jgi:integrase